MGRFSGDLDTKSIAGHWDILGKKNPHRSGAKRGWTLLDYLEVVGSTDLAEGVRVTGRTG